MLKYRGPAEAIEEKVRRSFAQQSFMVTLGALLQEIGPGVVGIAFSHRPDSLQQHGFLHGGAVAAILDSACGYAALSVKPVESEVLTIEYKISFLRPAAGTTFEAVGRVIRSGNTIANCEGEAWETEPSRRLIAKMSSTMAIRHD